MVKTWLIKIRAACMCQLFASCFVQHAVQISTNQRWRQLAERAWLMYFGSGSCVTKNVILPTQNRPLTSVKCYSLIILNAEVSCSRTKAPRSWPGCKPTFWQLDRDVWCSRLLGHATPQHNHLPTTSMLLFFCVFFQFTEIFFFGFIPFFIGFFMIFGSQVPMTPFGKWIKPGTYVAHPCIRQTGAHDAFVTPAHQAHQSFLKPSQLLGEYTAQLLPFRCIRRLKHHSQLYPHRYPFTPGWRESNYGKVTCSRT